PAPRATTGGPLRGIGIGLVAAGVAGVGTGAGLRLIASHKSNAIDEDARAMRPYDPANGNWRTYKGLSTAAFVAGGASLVAGGVLILLGGRSGEATTLVVAPNTSGDFLMTLAGTFR